MGRPKKARNSIWNYRTFFESAVILIVFMGASIASLSIDYDYGTMMIIPGVLLLNRVGLFHNALTLTVFLIGLVYLYESSIEAFFIIIVHSLFYGLVAWQSAEFFQDKSNSGDPQLSKSSPSKSGFASCSCR